MRIFLLIPYHGTEVISPLRDANQRFVPKEKTHGKDNQEDCPGLHLQLHERRLPLQSLRLQKLRLLT